LDALMAQDDHEIERHLTPNGWVNGNEWVNGLSIKSAEPPADRIETWIELISDSSEGWAPPVVTSRLVWQSSDPPNELRDELNKKFPRPEARPWKQAPRKKKRGMA
jgi:hypothetical protein